MDRNPPYWKLVDRPMLKVQVEWEPRDVWIGLFWHKTVLAVHLYICLIPLMPLHVMWARPRLKGEG